MKAIPTELRDKLRAGATTNCMCWRVERGDGIVMGFTDHDENILVDGVLFEAASGFSASTIEQSLGLSVDNQNMAGALSSNYITERDIAMGRYDNANIIIFIVDWTNPTNKIKLAEGSIGEVRRKLTTFEGEFRSRADLLNQKMGRLFQRTCDADLGDKRCKFEFKNFSGDSLLVNIQDKITGAWDALRLFDEPEITDGPYTAQLLPWTVDGGLVGSDLRFQWPLTAGYSMKYGAAFGGSGVEVTGDIGPVVGQTKVKTGKKSKTYYPYYGFTIDWYVKPAGDTVYLKSSNNLIYAYNGTIGSPIGREMSMDNWYVLRNAAGTPVHTLHLVPGAAPKFYVPSISNLTSPRTASSMRTVLSNFKNGTPQTDTFTGVVFNFTGPTINAAKIGGVSGTIGTGTITLTGSPAISHIFEYGDVNNVSGQPYGIALVFDAEFTLTSGVVAYGKIAVGFRGATYSSTNLSFLDIGTNINVAGFVPYADLKFSYADTFSNVIWYNILGTAFEGTYEANTTSAPVVQTIPHGSLNVPANYPDMMMGTVFGFDLTKRNNYRLFLHATTDAQYYIGSPGWHPEDNADAYAEFLSRFQPRSTQLGSGAGSWNSEGWFQQSINSSRGPKMSELRYSPTGHWPDVIRYSDTYALLSEAILDFNEAVRLAVDWVKNGQPIARATLETNMLTTANDSAAAYLTYDLSIAANIHSIPGSVPLTQVDYNNWIDTNAIPNGSATAETLPFLRVPTRRANMSAATATEIVDFCLTGGITGTTDIKIFDIKILDQWVKGVAMNYTQAWTGPVRGKVADLPNPQDYEAKLYVITDAVYYLSTVDLDANSEFYFPTSGFGSKLISIREKTSGTILIEIKPGIGLLRSYRIPIPAPHATNIYDEMSAAMQDLTTVVVNVTPPGTGYTLTYDQFSTSVADTPGFTSPTSVSLQFKRNGQIVTNLFNYYKAIVYQNGTEVARANINGAGVVTFTGLAVWNENTTLKLYSRVVNQDDVIVYFALKNRNFVYDQGVAIIAACCLGDEAYAERWVQGVLNALYISSAEAPEVLGVRTTRSELIGNISFSVDRYTGVPPDDYVRTGATAWVGTALAFFLRTFPLSDLYSEVYDRLIAMMSNLENHYLIKPGHPDYKKDGNPPQPGNDPNLYTLLPPINGVLTDPTRNSIPSQYEDNRRGLYAGGLGAYVSAYAAYAPTYRIPWVASEHNIDMYFLLRDMHKLTADEQWKIKADELISSITNILWDENEGRLIQGCRAVSKDYATALDQHTWGGCMLVASGQPEKARRAIADFVPRFKWVVQTGIGIGAEGYGPYVEGMGLPAGQSTVIDNVQAGGVNLYTDTGPDYPGAVRGVWPEGTFGTVLAQLALGQKNKAADTYARVSILLDQFGYIYTTAPDAGYELQAWQSVAGTGWAIIAANPQGFWEVYDKIDTSKEVLLEISGPNSYVGVITSVEGRRITCTGIDQSQGQPGYYETPMMTGGVFKVKSGPLDGWQSEVKKHYREGNTMVLELWNIPPDGLIAGESFYVRAGCDKLAKTCYNRFSNFANFQGFPFMPGNDTYGKYPNQTDPKMDGGSDNIGWELQ